MPVQAVLFDLDDTLIVDEAISREAFAETARLAAALCGADSQAFIGDSMAAAKKRWISCPAIAYCKRIGISAYEGLWGNFAGDIEPLRQLQEWTPGFRTAVFEAALRAQEIEPNGAEEELAVAWATARKKLSRLMPDAREVVTRLAERYKLGLLTNGAPAFQRQKFAAFGLESRFQAVAVSGERDIGKPDPGIFHWLLGELAVKASEAVMVGNSLERDIAGARNAGICSVWIRVPGAEESVDVTPDFEILSLAELPAVLDV